MAEKRKTHVEASVEEQLLILRQYVDNRSNWPLILQHVRHNLDKLPIPAANLYRTEDFSKLKRRMSGQVKKLTKEGFTTNNQEMSQLIFEINLMERRYSPAPGTHPMKRKELSSKDCSRINNEVEKIVANLSQTTHKDNNEGRFENGGRSSSDEERPMSSRGKKNDEQEERISETKGVRNERESKKSCDERRVVRKNSNVRSKNESREERQNDERGNDFRRQAIEIDEDDEEEEAMPPAKKKTTSELAREAYEAYTREIDTNRRLADKMERCMDKFLNM